MYTTLPDSTIPDTSDFPARSTSSAPIADVPTAIRGERRDLAEEMGQLEDHGPELPDVGPDGFPADYDDYDRYQARMSLWINGRGPRPE